MSLATPDQIRRIHTLKSRAGLDEAAYRDALAREGVATSKAFTADQADAFIARLNALPQVPRSGARRPAKTASGGYAPILQALWIASWNLGIARSRDDAALLAFVERQTGLPHTRFLRDAADAAKAIEGLKKWISREGGVVWPAKRDGEGLAAKRAVLEAQWRKLIALGAVRSFGPPELHDGLAEYVAAVTRGGSRRLASLADPSVTGPELDAGSMALGRKLRAALAQAQGSLEPRRIAS